jgi:hypothetical protein
VASRYPRVPQAGDYRSEYASAMTSDVLQRLHDEWEPAWERFSRGFALLEVERDAAHARRILPPVLAGWVAGFPDLATASMVHSLQELGEGYALLSARWPNGKEKQPALPVRSVVESTLRSGGVDEASIRLLSIRATSAQTVAAFETRDARLHARDVRKLAVETSRGLENWAHFMQIRQHPDGPRLFASRGPQLRQTYCGMLSILRRQFGMLGAPSTAPGIERRAILLLRLIYAHEYLATTHDPAEPVHEQDSLTLDFVREYIHQAGVADWIVGQDIPLPKVFAA